MLTITTTSEDSTFIPLLTHYTKQHNLTLHILESPILSDTNTILITSNHTLAQQTSCPTILCHNTPPPHNTSHITHLSPPIALKQLIDIIESHLPSPQQQTDIFLTIGPYTLNTHTRTLHCNEPDLFSKHTTIHLTEKETALLQRLHQANGAAVSAKTLLQDIWGYTNNIDTQTLQTHIYRLRQKIDSKEAQTSVIATEGDGYKLYKI